MTRKVLTFRLSSSTEPGFPGSAAASIQVGYVRRAHGVKGGVVFKPLTDDAERLVAGVEFLTDSDDFPTLTIASIQPHKDGSLVSFAGINDRNTAESLRGVSLLISPEDRRHLDDDEFWPDQLIGTTVIDLGGVEIGRVVDVVAGSAQDRLRIDGPRGVFDVPFVAELVPKVDLAAGQIVIDPPEGLIS